MFKPSVPRQSVVNFFVTAVVVGGCLFLLRNDLRAMYSKLDPATKKKGKQVVEKLADGLKDVSKKLPKCLIIPVMDVSVFRSVFITVGTTKFDALAREVDSLRFLTSLKSLGCDKLVMQIGNGDYIPTLIPADDSSGCVAGIRCSWYRFKPTLSPDVVAASVVFSHAGAGSIFETLRAYRYLVVVVNAKLMHNHQMELAQAMADGGYCFFCEGPENLLDTLQMVDFKNLKQLPPKKKIEFTRFIDEEMEYC